MHESGIVQSLLREVERIARRHAGPKVLKVRVRIGALCPLSEEHLREHFAQLAEGTVAANARLLVDHQPEPADASTLDSAAQSITLVSLEVEDIVPITVDVARQRTHH